MKAPYILIVAFLVILIAGVNGHWEVVMMTPVALGVIAAIAAWRQRHEIQSVTVTSWDQQLGHYVVSQHDPI